jgi:putative FmdB family regulatory protein
MPMYAYNCTVCDHDFDTLVRASDVEPPVCPKCGSEKLQQAVNKICVEIKYPAIAQSWRRQALREGDLSNFSKKELQGKIKKPD